MNVRIFLLLTLVVVPGLLAAPLLPSAAQPPIPPFDPAPAGPLSSIAADRPGPSTWAAQPAYSGCGGVVAPVANPAYEQEVVDRVNAVRAANGLPPLRRVTLLDNAARYHAVDLSQDDYFHHDSYDRNDGQLVYACAWSARIASYYSDWQTLAENIAAGYATPQAVMDAWMSSPGHRDNILRDSVWEIGVGYFQGGGLYGRYWVQDFGRRFGVYPLIIQGDAETVNLPNVTLYIYGAWSEMRLRNNEGPWTAWQPFANQLNWQLDSRLGEQAVWVELREGVRTASSSDTIRVDGARLADIIAAADNWLCQAGEPCFDWVYDLDGDGDLDVVDVMRVAALWSG